jgi:hypothetical protein
VGSLGAEKKVVERGVDAEFSKFGPLLTDFPNKRSEEKG